MGVRSRGLPRSVAGGPSLRRLIEAQRELTKSSTTSPHYGPKKAPARDHRVRPPEFGPLRGVRDSERAVGRSDPFA